MKKNKIIIILIVVLILVFVFFQYFYNPNNFEWRETYKADSEEPYGCNVIYKLLDDYYEGKEFYTIDEFAKKLDTNDTEELSNYVFIGKKLHLDSISADILLKYVGNGNTAFISCKDFPLELSEKFVKNTTDDKNPDVSYDNEFLNEEVDKEGFGYDTYNSSFDSLVTLNFKHEFFYRDNGFSFSYVKKNELVRRYWNSINELFDDSFDNTTVLGYIEPDRTNFISVSYGKGKFLIHSTPLAFTNYHLLNKEAINYSNRVLSYLQNGDIHWDEKNKRRNYTSSNSLNLGSSPLAYILSQPSLKWSLYITLVLVLLYMIFRAKRKQRIIEVLPTNANTSLAFIKTIGRLYYNQNDHKKLAQLKTKHFMGYLRNKYGIHTKTINNSLISSIITKSEIPEQKVNKIFEFLKTIESRQTISPELLIDFHKSIEYFYQNSK